MKKFMLTPAFLLVSVQLLYAQSISININSPSNEEIIFTQEVSVNTRVTFRGLSTSISEGLNPVQEILIVESITSGRIVVNKICERAAFGATQSCSFSFKQEFTPDNYFIKVEAKIFDINGRTLTESEQINNFAVKNIKDAPIAISPVEEFFFDDGSGKTPSFKVNLVKGFFYIIEVSLKKTFFDESCDLVKVRQDGYFFNSFWGGTAQGHPVVEPVQAPASSSEFTYQIPEVVWGNFRKGGLSEEIRQIFYRLLVSTDPQFKNTTSTLENSAFLKAPFITLRSGPNSNVAPRCELTGFNLSGFELLASLDARNWPWEITIQDKDNGLQGLLFVNGDDEILFEISGKFVDLEEGEVLQLGGTKSPVIVRVLSDREEGPLLDLLAGDGIGSTACDMRTRVINESLLLIGTLGRYNPSDTRGGEFPAGVFTIQADWGNIGNPRSTITNIQFEVAEISNHARLINPEFRACGEGCRIVVDDPGALACQIEYTFEIGLTAKKPFRFFIDAIGSVVGPFAEQTDVR